MTTVVEISDSEDVDDCVIKSVVFIVDDEPESDLYHAVCKENKLLADFIEKCLKLENSKGMRNILKKDLLRHYYAADKTTRESLRFQKNLRRANHLLNIDPHHKFTHIRDLCNILKVASVKKRVPFVSITINLPDKNCISSELKRSNDVKLDLIPNISKKAKLNNHNGAPEPRLDSGNNIERSDGINDTIQGKEKLNNDIPPLSEHTSRSVDEQFSLPNDTNEKEKLNNSYNSLFSETTNISFNDTYDALDESMSMEIFSQQSNVSEEDKLLIPKSDVPVVPTETEKRLKVIERKIASYKKSIAYLDELEVDDDSVNSPYIKSERLKVRIVSLYKERCQLLGSQVVKRKGIRLKLADGHPPGPTRALERFLNKNFNKDGDPPFPDFCDVITCVTEANQKDDLGWTKAQIMNEASALFTLCGRALQKRRQKREYCDLVQKVRMEDLEKDPADEDPALLAKLEENRRIALKKESDILERYTKMQYLPPKSKPPKNITPTRDTGNENIHEIKEVVTQQEIIHNNNNTGSLVLSMDESEKNNDKSVLKSNDRNTVNALKSYLDIKGHETRKTLKITKNKIDHDCRLKTDVDDEQNVQVSMSQHNVDTDVDAVEHSNSHNEIIHKRAVSNAVGHIIEPVSKIKNKENSQNSICNEYHEEKNKLNVIKNKILSVESIKSQQNNQNEGAMGMFEKLGDNFTVTIEITNDS